MNFKPEKYHLGDTWHYSDGENVHAFYMQNISFDNTEEPESGSLGHAISRDMINWQELKPAILRGGPGSYDEMDLWTGCVFVHNGKWYMLCLSGNEYGQRNRTGDPNLTGRITIWAVADKVEGPYRECTDNALLGAMDFNGICAKTFLHNDKRYLFYTEAFTLEDGGIECYHSLPKEVVTDKDARLHLKWFKGIDELYKDEPQSTSKELALENTGRWGTIAKWDFDATSITAHPKHEYCVQMFDISAKNFVLKTTIQRSDCVAAGFIFDVDGDNIFCDNKIAMIDFEEKEVWLTRARNFKKTAARRIKLKSDTFDLKVLCYGKTVEAYVNDELYVHHLYDRKGGKIGLFADMGKVAFKDTVINVID